MVLNIPYRKTVSKEQILEVAEQTSIWGGIFGILWAGISQPMLYTLLPVPFALALSSMRRLEWEEAIQRARQDTIAAVVETNKQFQQPINHQVFQRASSLEAQIRELERAVEELEARKYLTRTHLAPITAKLRTIQRQQKVRELTQNENFAKPSSELQEQINSLQESVLKLSAQIQAQAHQPVITIERNTLSAPCQRPIRERNHRVAIFFDEGNIYHGAKELGIEIDYNRLLSLLKGKSLVCRASLYTGVDFSNNQQTESLNTLLNEGYQVTAKEVIKRRDGSKKANLDVELSNDLLMQALCNSYDTAVLVGGDGDLSDTVKRVRSLGKRVEVASFFDNVSEELIKVADAYHNLTKKREQIRKV